MVRGETDKKTNDLQARHFVAEIRKDMSDALKRKEKQKWAVENPKLDNARKLRGIYFIDPDDEEFKDIMKNARRKLEVPMPAAMPCKLQLEKYRSTCRVDDCKTKHAWRSWRPQCKERNQFIEPLQYRAQIYSYA